MVPIWGAMLPKVGSAQQVDTVYGFPAGAWALTFCDATGHVKSWMDIDIPSDAVAMVQLHERNHQIQSHRYPDCQAWQDATNTNPTIAMEGEVEAYCAALTLVPEEHLAEARSDFLKKVLRQFGRVFRIPTPVVVAFTHFCPVPTS